jgi:outer membrane murein-binding lipoprotein Lpp
MSHELLYTSVPRGLRTGEHGFCTVAATRGIPSAVAAKLESLSGYRHLYPPSDSRAELNPVMYSHLRLQLEGKVYHVLSRVADAGLDYSQRTNKFAHHVALERTELPPGGPAAVLLQPGFMDAEWGDRTPQILDAGRRPGNQDIPPRPCKRWELVTGDAGWAGVLAGMAMASRPAYLIYRPGVDPLPLIAEALALLPAQQRWNVTFSTYFLGLPPDVPCQWRCVVADTPEAKAALESPGAQVIMLEVASEEPPDSPLVEAARTGRVPREASVAKPPRSSYPVAAPVPIESRFPTAAAMPMAEATPAPAYAEAPMPMPLSDPPRRSGGALWLALGLGLGLVLMFLCVLPIELLTGRSLPRAAGLASKDEQEMQAKVDALSKDVEKERSQVRGLEEDLVRARDALKRAENNAGPQPHDKPPEKEPGGWFGSLFGKKSDSEKLKSERDEARKKAEKLEKENARLAEQVAKIKELERKPAGPMGVGAGAPPPPAAKPSTIEPPLSLDAATKPISLVMKKSAGGRLELLGLPSRVEQRELRSRITDAGDIHVLVGDQELASFRHSMNPDSPWEFAWGKAADQPDFKLPRSALLRCVLKLTRPADESVSLYPLEQIETPIECRLKADNAGDSTLLAKLPLNQDALPDAAQGGYVLGNTAEIMLNTQRFTLKKAGDRFVTGDKDQPQVELKLEGDVLRLKFLEMKQAPTLSTLRADLSRRFGDVTVQIGVIKASGGPN